LLRYLTAAAASAAVFIHEQQTPTLHGSSIARPLNLLITGQFLSVGCPILHSDPELTQIFSVQPSNLRLMCS
jgi:hypothetical protein